MSPCSKTDENWKSLKSRIAREYIVPRMKDSPGTDGNMQSAGATKKARDSNFENPSSHFSN